MAAPVPDSYSAPSGTPINAGCWPAAQYAATVAKSSNVAGDANPGDTVTYTVDLTKTGSADLLSAVLADEIDDGNLALVPGSATTNVGTVTQDDSRVEIAVGTLSSTAQITYQAVINVSMPDSLVSNRALLTSARVVPTLSNLHHETVVAVAGDTDISGFWTNLGFESDVLTIGTSQNPATDWTNAIAHYPNDGFPAYEGNNVGRINVSTQPGNSVGTYAETGEATYRVQGTCRLVSPPSQYYRIEMTVKLTYDDGVGTFEHTCDGFPGVDVVNEGDYGRFCAYLGTRSAYNFSTLSVFPDSGISGRDTYIDDISIVKLGTWHPAQYFGPNSAGGYDRGIAFMADPLTLGARDVYVAPVEAGDGVARIPRIGRYSNKSHQYQNAANSRAIYQADGSLLFDGVDDRYVITSSGLVDSDIGLNNEPVTIVFRAKFLSRSSSAYTYILELATGGEWGFQLQNNDDAFRMRANAVTYVAIPNFLATYQGQDLVFMVHYETGNSFVEIYGGTNYPVAGAVHTGFVPIDSAIGSAGYFANLQAPHMNFWGAVIYGGWDTSLNDKIATYLNSLGA